MTIENKENVLDHKDTQDNEDFNKKQKKALKLIVEKEISIQKTQDEIKKLLQENNLNTLDVYKYKHDKNIDKFLNLKFPK